VLRWLFGPEKDGVTVNWKRKLSSEELHSIHSLPRIIGMVKSRMDRTYSTNEENRNKYRISVKKLERKRTLGRPRHSCISNIKMNLTWIERGCIDWIDLTQLKVCWRVLVY
jgi:hypothetical protein